MSIPDRNTLINRLSETRLIIENILPEIDVHKEIYPGWNIKDLLAHMSGWDEVVVDALRAYLDDRQTPAAPIHSLDQFNDSSVSSRKDMDFEQVISEWRLTRQQLCKVIEQLPESKLSSPVAVPWGGKPTVTDLVDIFYEHEESHTQDILDWLKSPDKPLVKGRN